MTRRHLLLVGVLVVGASAAASVAVLVVDRSGASADAAATTGAGTEALATATIERRTLSQRVELDGTLAYDDAQALAGAGAGVLTRLPVAGSVIGRGDPLYYRNEVPVVAFFGTRPLYRRLSWGDEGADVHVLERNLHALGYDVDAMTVDQEFDSDTTAAVKAWQDDIGVDETGIFEVGDAIVVSGPRRVGTLAASVGAPAGGKLYDTTATERVVGFSVKPSQRGLVAVGMTVEIELPSERIVKARISEIARVVREEDDGQGGTTPYIDVEARFAKGTELPALDQAPVDVRVEQSSEEDALAVPVPALLALAGGGYGVEVAGSAGNELVPVEVGSFADGYVVIRGDGLEEGDAVVVPA